MGGKRNTFAAAASKKLSVELHFLEPRRFPALDKDNQMWKEADRQAAKKTSR